MKQRCNRPNHQAYHNYGGRGIKVCDRWLNSFDHFLEDMAPTWKKGLEIDRRDNNGDYSPENCRWVTRKTNCRNKRKSVPVWVLEAAEKNGVKHSTLHWRLARGVKPEVACSKKADLAGRFTTSETVGQELGSSSDPREQDFC
jgi:hypothetical protein